MGQQGARGQQEQREIRLPVLQAEQQRCRAEDRQRQRQQGAEIAAHLSPRSQPPAPPGECQGAAQARQGEHEQEPIDLTDAQAGQERQAAADHQRRRRQPRRTIATTRPRSEEKEPNERQRG